MTLSDLQYLMHQLGPATPEIRTIVQEAIDSWMVEFDAGSSIQIAWEARSMRVLIKCAMGHPDESTREEIYALLLHANRLLTGVADVKLALSDADDAVMLIGEYALKESTLDVLRQHVNEFLNFAENFSKMIANAFSEGEPEISDGRKSMHHEQV